MKTDFDACQKGRENRNQRLTLQLPAVFSSLITKPKARRRPRRDLLRAAVGTRREVEPTQKNVERQSWRCANKSCLHQLAWSPSAPRSRCLTRLPAWRAAGHRGACATRPTAGAPIEPRRAARGVHRAHGPVRSRSRRLVVHVQPYRAALLHAAAARPDPILADPYRAGAGRVDRPRRHALAQRDLDLGRARASGTSAAISPCSRG